MVFVELLTHPCTWCLLHFVPHSHHDLQWIQLALAEVEELWLTVEEFLAASAGPQHTAHWPGHSVQLTLVVELQWLAELTREINTSLCTWCREGVNTRYRAAVKLYIANWVWGSSATNDRESANVSGAGNWVGNGHMDSQCSWCSRLALLPVLLQMTERLTGEQGRRRSNRQSSWLELVIAAELNGLMIVW